MKKRLSTACIMVFKGGKILLSERREHKSMGGYYQCPGGKAELGEFPQDTAMRELQEETGLAIPPGRLSYIGDINATNNNYVCRVFTVVLNKSEEPKDMEPDDQGPWKWYTLEDAWKLKLLPGLAQALKELQYELDI
jgi:8-oxo-dGTP diphosphatase